MEKKLHSGIDTEDWEYALLEVEKSYGIMFRENELASVRTIRELLDAIDAKINGQNVEDCTTQQAFYRIRSALVTELNGDDSSIRPTSELDALIPRKGRRHSMKRVERHAGIKLDSLRMQRWLAIFLAALFMNSLISFSWSGRTALLGLGSFGILLLLARATAREFSLRTVGELAERASIRSYRAARRDYGTVNRKEIRSKLMLFFQEELGYGPEELREDMLIV